MSCASGPDRESRSCIAPRSSCASRSAPVDSASSIWISRAARSRRRRSFARSSGFPRTAWPSTATTGSRRCMGRTSRRWFMRLSHAIASGLNFDAEYRTSTSTAAVRWLATRGEIARDADGDASPAHRHRHRRHRAQAPGGVAQAEGRIAQHRADRGGHRDHGPRHPRGSAGSARRTSTSSSACRSADGARRLERAAAERAPRRPRAHAPRAARHDARSIRPFVAHTGSSSPTDCERWIGEKADVTSTAPTAGRCASRARSWTSPSSSSPRPRSPRPRSASRAPCAARATACGSSTSPPDEFWFGPRFEELLGLGSGRARALARELRAPDPSGGSRRGPRRDGPST